MPVSRRAFLKDSGLGLLALGFPPSFLLRAARAADKRPGRALVVVFQRGGMDGLNAVIPFREASYYKMRPTIAIPEPAAREGRGIDLDGFYALHPALAPLKPIYDQGRLAIVHAAGSPNNTRSHFDAQDYMETGTPGVKSTPDGWLNRHLGGGGTPLRAVALTGRLPRILYGDAPALNLTSIAEFRLRAERATEMLERLYADAADPVFQASGRRLLAAIRALAELRSAIPAASGKYPQGPFGSRLSEIARLIKANIGLEIAFTEIEGWDTHVNEGGTTGILANRLRTLAEGLSAFFYDLGERMEEVVLVTLSEFGRTARENGNRGTDHGHANAMFVMGGKVRGGKVYGAWPGLEPEQLHEGRDLALTTDFRAVCADILARHLGAADINKVFPAFRSPPEALQWAA
ncbi:MAG TPA: DUF1501 domain-containing protein [Candidatus Acidoferrales bacterium]|nr:DUF1501 domain-containing protein [Candidatus Acidoferrales bacterium]